MSFKKQCWLHLDIVVKDNQQYSVQYVNNLVNVLLDEFTLSLLAVS